MTILVILEHDGTAIAATTRATINAALKLSKEIHGLLLGKGLEALAQKAAQIEGLTKILTADHEDLEHPTAENGAVVLKSIAQNYTHLLATASTFGKNLMPRVAALLDVGQLSDVLSIEAEDTFTRPIYAGNAIATVKSQDPLKVLTVRPTVFDKVAESGGNASIEALEIPNLNALSSFVELRESKSDRPDLTTARVVVSGGRGLQSGENFKIIEALADKLGAAIGASRAAVDAGYVPNDYQVGQTGKIVAPELYIAIGISGAIQHLAGMKDSKVIVAINKDEDAPIFQIADYGIVGDLFDIVPKLTEQL